MNHFDYFTDIENTFIRRRGKHMMISPLDWALIESWQKKGIPLSVVVRAINEVFDSVEQRAEKKTNVRSLKYCSDAVERLFAEWSTANVGKEKEVAGSEEVSYSDHIQVRIKELEKVSERLPRALYETVQAIIAELSALDISGDKNVEEKLESLDRRLDQSIFDNIETIKTAQIETAVASQTSGLDLNSENTDQAYQRIFCREVRRTHGLPVLSLYGL